MRIPLTDKQREWLESLSKEDIQPFNLTVKHTLDSGEYGLIAQNNLRKLVINYKIKRDL